MSAKVERPLPRGWVTTTLGDVTQPCRPRHRPSDYPNLPFIGMEHIEAHTMRLLGTVPAHTMKSSAVHSWPGDVLYGRLRPYLNKVYRQEFEGLCSAEFIVLPASEHLNSGYLKYFLNSYDFVSFASQLNTGDRPRVDFEQIRSYSIPLPPLGEQHRIVAEIDKQFTRLDASVAALKRARGNLKRHRAAVLQAACEGRLVPTEAELARAEGRTYEPAGVLLERILRERRAKWEAKRGEPSAPDTSALPELPEGWMWATLEQIVSATQNGLSKRRGEQGTLTRVLRLSDIVGGRISESDPREIRLTDREVETYELEPGDLVCIRVNGSRDLVGRLVPFQSGNRWAFCDHFIRLTTRSDAVVPAYLALYGGTSRPRRQIELSMVSSAGQNTVSQTTLLGLPVPIPPVAEQHRIVAELERRLSLVDELAAVVEHSLKLADRLRQAILKRAFEGKLVAQDPNDEPANVLLERIRAERAAQAQSRNTRRPRRAPRRQRTRRAADSLSARPTGVAK